MTQNIKPVRELLQNFRQSRISAHTLPSGLEVQLKAVSIEDLATSGQIPDTLTALVMKTAVSGKPSTVSSEDDYPTLLTLFGVVAKASIVFPPVVDGEGDEEHLGLNELSFSDKKYIFDIANGEAKRLENFRPEQRRNNTLIPDGENVQPATE